MKKIFFLTLFALLLCAGVYAAQKQDVVYLKNGSIIRGEITEQIPDKSIKIETGDGSVFVYKMSEVEKITKETVKGTDKETEKPPKKIFGAINLDSGKWGVHAGIGTDISLGLAFGGGVNYLIMSGDDTGMEFGLDLYYSHTDVSEADGPLDYIYRDVTDAVFYALSYNILINYAPKNIGMYYVLGAGAGAASVSWTGSSTDDPTYDDSWDRTAGGALINLGLGWIFGGGFELRLQAPVMFVFGAFAYTAIVPMLNVAGGIRF